MIKQTIPVVGMACAACAANVERKLNALEGVASASVSLPTRTALIEYDPARITLQAMKEEINAIGFDLVIEADRDVEEIERQEYVSLKRKTLLSWFFSLLVMAVAMRWIPIGSQLVGNLVAMVLALCNMVFCGRQFYVVAWKQLRHGWANMDTLVALSTGITFLFSAFNTFWGDRTWGVRGMEWHTYYEASAMIISFVLTGRLLEEKAKDGTASSIRQLMGMTPKTAHIVERKEKRDAEGNVVEPAVVREVPIATIEKGDIL
jgi:Cu2+-exporting ATPase